MILFEVFRKFEGKCCHIHKCALQLDNFTYKQIHYCLVFTMEVWTEIFNMKNKRGSLNKSGPINNSCPKIERLLKIVLCDKTAHCAYLCCLYGFVSN